MADQRDIREEEPERTFPQPSPLAFLGNLRVARAEAVFSAGETVAPETRLEKKRGIGLRNTRPVVQTRCNLLCNDDLPVKQDLVMARAGRRGPDHDPQPAETLFNLSR